MKPSRTLRAVEYTAAIYWPQFSPKLDGPLRWSTTKGGWVSDLVHQQIARWALPVGPCQRVALL